MEANPGGPGRPSGSKDLFPRNSYTAMKELIAGRIMKVMKDRESKEVQKSPAEIMADAILEGMQGKLIISSSKHGVTYANPLHAVKLFQDYMLKAKELQLRVEELRKKEKGTGGGIRIVLPSVLADPLLKPGQKPRPLRLLGQDPSKPLSDATGTAADAQPSLGAVRTHEDRARKSAHARSTSPAITSPQQRLHRSPSPALAPNSEDAFDPAELIEDFEYPICQICMGTRMVRDENGIHIVTCPYCEGAGRAPAPA